MPIRTTVLFRKTDIMSEKNEFIAASSY